VNDKITVTLMSKEAAEADEIISRQQTGNQIVHFPLDAGPWETFVTLIPPRLILGTRKDESDPVEIKPADKD
jgi:hypothetical protein